MNKLHHSARPSADMSVAATKTTNWELTPLAKALRVAVAGSSLFAYATAHAGPQGEVVQGGAGSVSRPDSATTLINQGSQRLALQWNSFNVAPHERVQFVQPGASAVALNRIVDVAPSQVFGQISANGHVILANPNGVLFGRTSHVRTGNLTAAAMDADVNNFMAGRATFSAVDGAAGTVVNQGLLEAATGGEVTLLGRSVVNEGVIVANQGKVTLAAGEHATVDFTGDGLLQIAVDEAVTSNPAGADAAVLNDGSVQAAGGEVLMTATAARDVFSRVVVNNGMVTAGAIDTSGGTVRLVARGADAGVINTGSIDASGATGGTVEMLADANVAHAGSVSADGFGGAGGHVRIEAGGDAMLTGDSTVNARSNGGVGGDVEILGERVGLMDHTNVDVSGDKGGGTALIGGDYRGLNPDVRNARQTALAADASVLADAVESGDGGRVILWADGDTWFHGNISARGGALEGNGGFVETSGAGYLQALGRVRADAPNGRGGEWLIDPRDIEIVGGNGNLAAPFTTPEGDGTSTIKADDLVSALNTGTGQTITITTKQTTDTNGNKAVEEGKNSGNITLTSGVSIASSFNADSKLQLIADNDVILNGKFTDSGDTKNIDLVISAKNQVQFNNTLTVENLTVEATGPSGKIADGQNVDLRVDGLASFSGSTITLGDALKDNKGNENENGTGSDRHDTTIKKLAFQSSGDVTISIDNAVTLEGALANKAANLVLRATGDIGQNQAVAVTGTSQFIVTTPALDNQGKAISPTAGIKLDNSENLFDGQVTFGNGVDTRIKDLSFTNKSKSTTASLANLSNLTKLNDVTLNLSAAGIELPALSVGGNLTVTSGGAITQGGALSVKGSSEFKAQGQNITLTKENNDFGSDENGVAVTLRGKDVQLVNSDALKLGASTITGDLKVDSKSGGIIQSGALTVTGTSSFTAATGKDITLSITDNDFKSQVTTKGANVTIQDANDLSLGITATGFGSVTAGGSLGIGGSTGGNLTTGAGTTTFSATSVGSNLSVTAGGAVTGGSLKVKGTSNIDADGQDITLVNAANDFDQSVSLIGNEVELVASEALELGKSTIASDLTVTAGGNITQSGVLDVKGASQFNVSNTASIELDDQPNVFTKGVTFGLANGDKVEDVRLRTAQATTLTFGDGTNGVAILRDVTLIVDDGDIALGAFNGNTGIGGNLSVTATKGAITQDAASGKQLSVKGTSTFTAAGNITLNNDGNNFDSEDQGNKQVTTTGANITIRDKDNLSLGITASGFGLVTAGGSLGIGGSTGGNLTTDAGTTTFSATSVGGNLSVTADGAVTGGSLKVKGTSNIAADGQDITLVNAANDFDQSVSLIGNKVELVASEALELGKSTIASDLTVTAGGKITQSGVLGVKGASQFNVSKTASIEIHTQPNVFTNGVTFGLTTGDKVEDVRVRTTQATTLTFGDGTNGVENLRDLTLIVDDGDIALGAFNGNKDIGGNLSVEAKQGEITQGPGTQLSVKGTSSFTAATGKDITLSNKDNDFKSQVTTKGANVTIQDVNDLSLGIEATGSGSVTAGGSLGIGGSTGGALTTGAGTTKFSATSVGGNLKVTAGGSVTGGPLTVNGSTTIDAGSNDIKLTNASNDFDADEASDKAVSLIGDNVELVNSDALELGQSTIAGNLTVTAGGDITQSGKLIVNSAKGTSIFKAENHKITLTNAENALDNAVGTTASEVALTNSKGITLADTKVSGDYTVTAIGKVSQIQSSTITVGGKTAFSTGGGDLSLAPSGFNDFKGLTTISGVSGKTVTIRTKNIDLGDFNPGAGTTVSITGEGLTKSGTFRYAGNASAVTKGSFTFSKDGAVVGTGKDFEFVIASRGAGSAADTNFDEADAFSLNGLKDAYDASRFDVVLPGPSRSKGTKVTFTGIDTAELVIDTIDDGGIVRTSTFKIRNFNRLITSLTDDIIYAPIKFDGTVRFHGDTVWNYTSGVAMANAYEGDGTLSILPALGSVLKLSDIEGREALLNGRGFTGDVIFGAQVNAVNAQNVTVQLPEASLRTDRVGQNAKPIASIEIDRNVDSDVDLLFAGEEVTLASSVRAAGNDLLLYATKGDITVQPAVGFIELAADTLAMFALDGKVENASSLRLGPINTFALATTQADVTFAAGSSTPRERLRTTAEIESKFSGAFAGQLGRIPNGLAAFFTGIPLATNLQILSLGNNLQQSQLLTLESSSLLEGFDAFGVVGTGIALPDDQCEDPTDCAAATAWELDLELEFEEFGRVTEYDLFGEREVPLSASW